MNSLIIALATISVACAAPSSWLVGGHGLGLSHGIALAGPSALGASIVGPSIHGATVVGPSTHGAAVVGPSVGPAAIIGASSHGTAVVGPAVAAPAWGLGLSAGAWGGAAASAHGVTVAGPLTVPATIAGPSGAIHANGLWGPTLAHGGHW